jgi:hypothetical protein
LKLCRKSCACAAAAQAAHNKAAAANLKIILRPIFVDSSPAVKNNQQPSVCCVNTAGLDFVAGEKKVLGFGF